MVDINKIKMMMIRYGENPRQASALSKDKRLIKLAKDRGAKTPAEFAKMIKSFSAFKNTGY